MTEDEIDKAIEGAMEMIHGSPAMTPGTASQQDSIDFIDGLIDEIKTVRNTIRMEMEG